ncbi:unnamed protein product [Echinostoma caproni]|uniref:Carn_acyltransf domain-containing protein n=1 Tax=Echinostoma caproni TaxID=27848 RepID=A0A183B4A5_9TREM|nr:unnamed protein product [Echinostoma caproni]
MACTQGCLIRYHTVARFSTTALKRAANSGKDAALKKSVLTTDHFQSSLPVLKVPALEDTILRYLKSQEAILDPEQLKKTTRAAKKFLKIRGPALQKTVMEFARTNTHTSYITKMWFDMYLSDRRPVVLTHNPVIVFKDTERGPGYEQPSIRATNLIHGILRFAKLLRSNTLKPDVFHLDPRKSDTPFFHQTMRFVPKSVATYAAYMFKAFPLDMSQYPSMFNGTRIPKPSRDELFSESSAKHIAVIHKGQTYIFDVMDEHGALISPKRLLASLEFILSQPDLLHTPGVGTITAMSRDDAYVARQRLVRLGNAANLKLIDSAFILLVLDDTDISDPSSLVSIIHAYCFPLRLFTELGSLFANM